MDNGSVPYSRRLAENCDVNYLVLCQEQPSQISVFIQKDCYSLEHLCTEVTDIGAHLLKLLENNTGVFLFWDDMCWWVVGTASECVIQWYKSSRCCGVMCKSVVFCRKSRGCFKWTFIVRGYWCCAVLLVADVFTWLCRLRQCSEVCHISTQSTDARCSGVWQWVHGWLQLPWKRYYTAEQVLYNFTF